MVQVMALEENDEKERTRSGPVETNEKRCKFVTCKGVATRSHRTL